MATLRRTRDGAGDSGPMFAIFRSNPKTGKYEYKNNTPPQVGWSVQCGSIYARSFSAQDYWMTTPVTEILEETDKGGRFKTGNSEYIWTKD